MTRLYETPDYHVAVGSVDSGSGSVEFDIRSNDDGWPRGYVLGFRRPARGWIYRLFGGEALGVEEAAMEAIRLCEQRQSEKESARTLEERARRAVSSLAEVERIAAGL